MFKEERKEEIMLNASIMFDLIEELGFKSEPV